MLKYKKCKNVEEKKLKTAKSIFFSMHKSFKKTNLKQLKLENNHNIKTLKKIPNFFFKKIDWLSSPRVGPP